mgnify:CR=1 FL=1
MTITINNEEVLCSNDFTIKEEMLNTPSVILNNVYPKSWENDKDYVSRFYHPKDYSQCCIYDGEDLIFCGVVKNSGQISLNPRHPHYSTLQILDYKTFLSEGETLDFVIANKTIEEAINQIIDVIAPYGFELGELDINGKDDIIGAYSTKDMTAYDVFNYLTDITQSRWTTRVLGEGQVAIDFYDPSNLPLGTTLNYNETWFKNNDIDDISYNYGTWDYRNKQVMTSKEVYGSISQTQTILYDGYATQIMIEYPIGRVISIKVNGVEKKFATKEDKDLGIYADFYYERGKNFFEKNMSLNAGNSIVIEYLPIVEGRQIITNPSEISRIATATGVKGIISRYENRNDATTSMELQKIGQSYIKYKGTPEIKLTIKTRHNLWNVGDRVPTLNMPITDLATTYMVKKKSINYITTADTIFYTFELTSSFNAETEINYFDNQRAKSNGNIKEGEFVSRNIDLSQNYSIIFYDTEAEATTITGNNELQATLETTLLG